MLRVWRSLMESIFSLFISCAAKDICSCVLPTAVKAPTTSDWLHYVTEQTAASVTWLHVFNTLSHFIRIMVNVGDANALTVFFTGLTGVHRQHDSKAVEERSKDIGTIKIHFHDDDALEERRVMVEAWKFSAVVPMVGCLREMKEYVVDGGSFESKSKVPACGVTVTVAKHNNKHCGFEQHSFSSRQTHAYRAHASWQLQVGCHPRAVRQERRQVAVDQHQ